MMTMCLMRGPCVGVGIGVGVGVGLGLGDGVSVGDGLGDGVSVGDGLGDGVSVGDGLGDGESVGPGDGVSVGPGDGVSVAPGVGVSSGPGSGPPNVTVIFARLRSIAMTSALTPPDEALMINAMLEEERFSFCGSSNKRALPATLPTTTGILTVQTTVLPRSTVPQPDSPRAIRRWTLCPPSEITSDGFDGVDLALYRDRAADERVVYESAVFSARIVTSKITDVLDFLSSIAFKTMGVAGTAGIALRLPPHAEIIVAHINAAT